MASRIPDRSFCSLGFNAVEALERMLLHGMVDDSEEEKTQIEVVVCFSPWCSQYLLSMWRAWNLSEHIKISSRYTWMNQLVWYIFVHTLQTYWALIDMPPWPYHYKWYLGQGMESRPWPCYRSVLIGQKQYAVYYFSLVCKALALLSVPLQVSTTGLWCISQFSERVSCRNVPGILTAGSEYIFWDQSNWSCD